MNESEQQSQEACDHPAQHLEAVYAGVYLAAQAGASFYAGALKAYEEDEGADEFSSTWISGLASGVRRAKVELDAAAKQISPSVAGQMRTAIDDLIRHRNGQPVDLAIIPDLPEDDD